MRDQNDQWIRIAVKKGGMIVLPAGMYHRFTLDTNNYIKVLLSRIFYGQFLVVTVLHHSSQYSKLVFWHLRSIYFLQVPCGLLNSNILFHVIVQRNFMCRQCGYLLVSLYGPHIIAPMIISQPGTLKSSAIN